jgi:S-adenosylmethionine synthetase
MKHSLIALADCAATIFADVCKNSKIELVKVESVAETEKPLNSPKLIVVTVRTHVSAKARKELLEAAWNRSKLLSTIHIQEVNTTKNRI